MYIDDDIFRQKRYGFNPEQARTDTKAVDAAKTMQKAIRRFLGKIRHMRLYSTPGYAIATGVFVHKNLYLVYIFRASSD